MSATGSRSMLNNDEIINRPALDCCHPKTHAPISVGQSYNHHRHDGHHDDHHHDFNYYSLAAHRPRQRRALLISIVLTGLMMVIEFAAGWMTGSLMLTSDAVHMLSHAAALGVSLTAIMLARRQLGDHLPPRAVPRRSISRAGQRPEPGWLQPVDYLRSRHAPAPPDQHLQP
jgi:hypothetical protein